MNLSRRSILYAAAAATGARLASPGEPSRGLLADTSDFVAGKSGLITGEKKPLPYTEVEGFLSAKQIEWHHGSHYAGALRGFVKLDAAPTGNHRARVAKANSVVMHELYFDGMTAKKTDPEKATKSAVEKRFGSLDRWIDDFRAAAKSCRGWAVLGYHPVNGKLYNMSTDSHDNGPAWFGVPLVVVDMYEHSYYIDYQNKKADYADKFTDHVNWAEIERRLRACRG